MDSMVRLSSNASGNAHGAYRQNLVSSHIIN